MKSRFIQTRTTKLPRHRRSERLYGSFEDANRWIRCWNCGQINDLTKLSTGDGSGIVVTDFPIGPPDVEPSGILGIELQGNVGVLIELGADGEPITDYYTPRKSTAVSGCWFCGCRNLP